MRRAFVLVFTTLCCLLMLGGGGGATRLRLVREESSAAVETQHDVLRSLDKYGIDVELAQTLAQYCALVRSCEVDTLRRSNCGPDEVEVPCVYRASSTNSALEVIEVIDDAVTDMTVLVGANHKFRMIVAAFRGTASIKNMLEDVSVQTIAYPTTSRFALKYDRPQRPRIFGLLRNLSRAVFDDGADRVAAPVFKLSDTFNATVVDEETIAVFLNGSMVHSGFYSVWTSVAPHLMSAIDEARRKYPDYPIVFTGYSLGGAVASLGATAMRLNGTHTVDAVYTFGEPKVGNDVFAEFVQHFVSPRRFRFVNQKDIVPLFPFDGLRSGYQHAGIEVFLDRTGNVTQVCDTHCKDPNFQGSLAVFRYSVLEHFSYLNVTMHSKCGLLSSVL